MKIYFDSFKSNDYTERYECLSSEDKKYVTMEEWRNDQYFAAVDFYVQYQTHNIIDTAINCNKATVTVEVRSPDRRALRFLRLSDELKDKSEVEAFEIMSSKYKDSIPYTTEISQYDLVLENDDWKINFGYSETAR